MGRKGCGWVNTTVKPKNGSTKTYIPNYTEHKRPTVVEVKEKPPIPTQTQPMVDAVASVVPIKEVSNLKNINEQLVSENLLLKDRIEDVASENRIYYSQINDSNNKNNYLSEKIDHLTKELEHAKKRIGYQSGKIFELESTKEENAQSMRLLKQLIKEQTAEQQEQIDNIRELKAELHKKNNTIGDLNKKLENMTTEKTINKNNTTMYNDQVQLNYQIINLQMYRMCQNMLMGNTVAQHPQAMGMLPTTDIPVASTNRSGWGAGLK